MSPMYGPKVTSGWVLSLKKKFGQTAESPFTVLGGHFAVVSESSEPALNLFLQKLQSVDPMYHYSKVGFEFIKTNGPVFHAQLVTVQQYFEPGMKSFLAVAYTEGQQTRRLFQLGQISIVHGHTVAAARQNYLDIHPNANEFEIVPERDDQLIRYTGFPPAMPAPIFFEEVTILAA